MLRPAAQLESKGNIISFRKSNIELLGQAQLETTRSPLAFTRKELSLNKFISKLGALKIKKTLTSSIFQKPIKRFG